MPDSPTPIASLGDVQRLSATPYREFMPHARVLAGLEHSALRHGDRTALTGIHSPDPVAPVRRWTYGELVADVRQAANLFHALSGGSTPRVALLLPPIPETHVALWGAETAGTACPINFQLNSEHIADLITASQADILVALGPCPDLQIAEKALTLQASCPGLRHVLFISAGPECPLPTDYRDFMAELALRNPAGLDFEEPLAQPAALFHTGGTTGTPKLAQHSHANQLHAAWGAACMYGLKPTDVILNGFPLFHVAGSFVYGLSVLLSGGEVVLPTRLGLRNAELMKQFGRHVERFGVTLLAAVPTVIASLLALNLDNAPLRSVRALLTGGSPLPDELAAAFEARHTIPVRNILGMTESGGVISIEPVAAARTPGSCGLPLPFTEVSARLADGSSADFGQSGVICVRGPNVSPGYTDASRNAGTFEGGWLISGDIGHTDAAGRVFVTGRAKDVIIRGAHNIDPGLIESVLLRHPEVLMAAAIGEPDPYAGELPVAYVSLKPGATVTSAQLAEFAAPMIAERPAVPKRIDIVPSLPVTAIGKVYKPALRALATHHALQAQLAEYGLESKASVDVEEAPRGIVVRFEVQDAATESGVREMMKPFALSYSTVLKGAT